MAASRVQQNRTTTERGLDRLVNFTDASVAIAITFLVLPLVDVTEQLDDRSLADVLGDNIGTLAAFVISFAVIGRLWMVHNALFEWVADYTPSLVAANFLWLASIVFVPFAANVLSYADHDRLVYVLYIATMLIASLATLIIQRILIRSPRLLHAQAPARSSIPSIATILILAVAATLAFLVPSVNMYWLLLLILSRPVERLLGARMGAKERRHTNRGLDRIVGFSDATVAIAITILVLPLVTLAPQIGTTGSDLVSVVAENSSVFLAFGLSFVVIAAFWMPHHRVFELVGDHDAVLTWANLVWLLGIAFFPFSTSVVAQTEQSVPSNMLYVGTMIVISGALVLIDLVLIRRPHLRRDPAEPLRVRFALVPFALLVLAGVLVVLVPAVGLWWLLLLTGQRLVLALIDRWG